jgi:hypothetical protein
MDSQALFAELISLSPEAREEFILIFQEARAHCVERTCAGAGLTRDEQIRFENRRAFHETLARRLREARKRS